MVHIGAGIHSKSKQTAYKRLIKSALIASQTSIIEASQKLEASPLTNTGYGSSLTIDGDVSCDASIIEITPEHRNQLGAHDIKRLLPITETSKVLQKLDLLYGKGPFERLGITKPIELDFKQKKAIDGLLGVVEPEPEPIEDFVLPRAQRIYDYYINNSDILHPNQQQDKEKSDRKETDEKIKDADSGLNHADIQTHLGTELDLVQDTIGLVQLKTSSVTMCTSSGGNFFKLPGRIGCAGILGCAIESVSNETRRITCMCSGNGEQIIQLTLAKSLCQRALDYGGEDLAQELIAWMKSRLIDPYIGVILTFEDNQEGNRLLYFHSTESFFFGFLNHQEMEVVLSRLVESIYDTGKRKFMYGEFKI